MAIEAERLILGQQEDAAEIAVDAVRERDVNDAVNAAERHGGLGAIPRERPKPFALPAGEQDTDGVAHQGQRRPRSNSAPVQPSGATILPATRIAWRCTCRHGGG